MLTAKELDEHKSHCVFNNNIELKEMMRSLLPTLPKSKASVRMMAIISDKINPPKIKRCITAGKNMTDDAIIAAIKNTVIEVSGLQREKIFSPTRMRTYVSVRQVIAYILRLVYNKDVIVLGKILNQEHSTITYSCQYIYNALTMQHEGIRYLYQQSLKKLDENYNLFPDFSQKWWADLCERTTREFVKFSKKDVKKIIKLYETCTASEIAKMFGCKDNVIMSLFKRHKIKKLRTA